MSAAPRRLGVGVVGMGWMGHVHSRAYLAAAHRYRELGVAIDLVSCADASEKIASDGAALHGFAKGTADWRETVSDARVDVVSVTAPNFMHAEICELAAAEGKHIWCEKPVGRDVAEAGRAHQAASAAGVATMCGFNYRWAPMVRTAKRMLDEGELGEPEMFRGRFYSMFAYDRLGLHSWRFKRELAGHGATADLLSHVTDMALELMGPVEEVCGQRRTFIERRPLPREGVVSHYGRGEPGDPTAEVENEDYAGALVRFANGACGSIEGWRTACGPKSDMAFELYCTEGSVGWTLEDLNALRVFQRGKGPMDGYARVLAGEADPDHGRFVPGDGNPIGYEDTKAMEAAALLGMVARGETEPSGLARALDVSAVNDAVLRSCGSGKWERVSGK